LIPDDVIP